MSHPFDRELRLRDVLKEKGLWGLVLAGVVFFFRPLLLGETFFLRDLYILFLPVKALIAKLLTSGEMPYWNPYLHGGMPLLADISSSTLYPVNVLWLLVAPTTALSLDVVLHVIGASAAAYVLARCLGARPAAAFIAGAVYGYCGFTLSQANLLVRLQATPWVPLLLLFWHLFLGSGRRRWLGLAIACGVAQILAGAPTVIAPCLVLALGWGLGQATTRRHLARTFGSWVVLSAAIAGLGALQLVPTFELAAQSSRGEGMSFNDFGFWSLHPLRLPELVFPGYLGRVDAIADDAYWGAKLVDNGFPYFVSLYTGAIAIVLALLGALGKGSHRRLRLVLSAFAMGSVLLAFGRYLPGFELVYDFVPGIRVFRFPVKLLSLGVLPLALLAAFGAEAAAGKQSRTTLIAAWVVLGVPAAAILAALRVPAWSVAVQEALWGQSSARAADGLQASISQALGFWLAATLAVVAARRLGDRRWTRVLALVVIADLMLAGRPATPTAPAELITAVPEAARLVQREVGDGRLYRGERPEGFRLDMPTDDVVWLYRWNQEVLHFYLGASYGIPVIFHEDFHGLAPRRSLMLFNAVRALEWERRRPILAAAAVRVVMTHEEPAWPGLEEVGVLQNAGGMPVHLYRDGEAARRLEWIGVWHTVATAGEALTSMLSPGFDPRQHAVIEAPIADRPRAGCEAPARVELASAAAARRTYSVTAPCDGLLVFSESFYPGCEVHVDGQRVAVLPANVAFTAAPVAAGEHAVEWRYVPRAFYRGLVVSGLTLLVLLAASFALRRRVRGA